MRRVALILFALLLVAGTTVKRGPGGGGGGGGFGAANVQNPAANNLGAAGITLITLAGCQGTAVSNSAIGEEARFDLCNAVEGMEVWVIWDDASQTLHVEPQAADQILAPEVNAIGDGLDWTATGTDGSVLHFYAPANDQWRVIQIKGSQPIDNNTGAS